jgi:acyl carrier protein
VNGKLDRKALPVPSGDADGEAPDIEPRNEVEAAVARIWQEVLDRPRVGIDRSFFDLGGHSLLVTQVVGRLSKAFRMRIPLRTFFAAPTVAGVAASMLKLEPRPGHVETIARVLDQIERMPEEERQERVRQGNAPPAGRPA